jgi:Holliday junction DNA helicase RuvA
MIDFLRGEIVTKLPTEVVLRVGGIGYAVQVPLSTFESLPDSGETTLLTYLQVREDGLRLFGFATAAEREMFLLLLSVAGIGPGIALMALSGSSVDQLRESILTEDVNALTRIKGIGKKTAQRIVVELLEPVKRISAVAALPAASARRNLEDAVLGLMSLGYSRNQAQNAVGRAAEVVGTAAKTEDLLREALKHV